MILKSSKRMKSFTLSADSSHVATVNEDNSIEFWNFKNAEKIYAPIDSAEELHKILYTPLGLHAILINKNGLIRELALPQFNRKTKGYFDSYFQTITADIENKKLIQALQNIIPDASSRGERRTSRTIPAGHSDS